MTQKYLIYSTFHPTGHLSRHVVDQLNAYKQLGFELIVVDTSPTYTDARKAFYTAIGATAIHRENTGYDFTSYKVGFEVVKKQHPNSFSSTAASPWVLLANDSCFGPLYPLETLFSKIPGEQTHPTCYGLTESWDRETFHLQSYWLYFNPSAFAILNNYFELMPDIQDREEAIQFGELGLSGFMAFQKVAMIALFPQDDCYKAYSAKLRLPQLVKLKCWLFEKAQNKSNRVMVKAMSRYLKDKPRFRGLNPSIDMIPTLVDELGCPFAKIQRFRDEVFKPYPYWRLWASEATSRYPILGEQCDDYNKTYKTLLNI